MKFKTIQPFICRISGDRYDIDDHFESDDVKRIEELQIKGFLDADEVIDKTVKTKSKKQSPEK